MGVVVYPRLGDVLTARDMTVADLKRAIEGRYGMRVNLVTLYELALAPERLHHVNIEVAAAAASVLDVTLDDLFVVEMSPNGANADTNGRILTRAESRRLEELLDRQGRTALSPAEQNELDHLIAMYGEAPARAERAGHGPRERRARGAGAPRGRGRGHGGARLAGRLRVGSAEPAGGGRSR